MNIFGAHTFHSGQDIFGESKHPGDEGDPDHDVSALVPGNELKTETEMCLGTITTEPVFIQSGGNKRLKLNPTGPVEILNDLSVTGIEDLKTVTYTGGISIGTTAGFTSQHSSAIAIGSSAGEENQSLHSIAMGNDAGSSFQSEASISIGRFAGESDQGTNSIAIGTSAGKLVQEANCIAMGRESGLSGQSDDAIALGYEAGRNDQGNVTIAIGRTAGTQDQSLAAIALGFESGRVGQGTAAVAIGSESGGYLQGEQSIAIGELAGNNEQGDNSIAIGPAAGNDGQGDFAIALGLNAGVLNQPDNSFIVSTQSVRDTKDAGESSLPMWYNGTTGEISFGGVPSFSGHFYGTETNTVATQNTWYPLDITYFDDHVLNGWDVDFITNIGEVTYTGTETFDNFLYCTLSLGLNVDTNFRLEVAIFDTTGTPSKVQGSSQFTFIDGVFGDISNITLRGYAPAISTGDTFQVYVRCTDDANVDFDVLSYVFFSVHA